MLQKEKDFSVRHAQLSKAKRALLEKRLRGELASSSEALTIARQPQQRPVPLALSQQGLWFLDQLVGGSPLYNIPAAVRLSGLLNITALHQGLNAIVQRHEALRTTFRMMEGQPVQVIAPTLVIPLSVIDLWSLPEAEREAEAQRLATEEAQRPFDLSQGPLVRATVLHLGAEEHLLLLTMHHIVSDGWSLGVLFQELTTLYEAFSAGRSSPLPELPIQYADFAVWQRQWLQGKVLETQLSYWRQQLSGAPTMLELPTDHPRPAVQTFRGAQQSFVLSRELSDALRALSRREGITLFMTLLATFSVLLYRYTGQTDIVIGSPVANRNRPELEGLIGFFVNTLVLRIDLAENPTFEQVLKRVREVALEAYAHQDLPFEKLVEELHPERNLSYNPLFQVMFDLQSDLKPTFDLPGLHLHRTEVENETAKFDLSLSLEDTGQGLTGLWEYGIDLFEPATIARIAGHFQTVLESIVAQPEQRVHELPLFTTTERQQILVEWNATQKEYPRDLCIHQLFEAQVERTPDAVAVAFEGAQLTYRELNRRANQLAYYLQKRGVQPDVLVGICVERSLEMVVGLLGVLKAGGAYVPLDPTYPGERLSFMLADAQVSVLLTQGRLVGRLPGHEVPVIALDADWGIIASQSLQNPTVEMKSENLVYVIFTSGSTGRPKGVLIPHSALVNHSITMAKRYGLRSGDRVLQFASISFDVAAEELFPTLLSGATVTLRPGRETPFLAEFSRLLEREELTVLNLPASYWHEWVSELSTSGAQLPSTLRLVIVGSEKVLPERLRLWQKLAGDRIHWVNAYGLTETTITAMIYEPDAPIGELSSVPIGRPIANTQIYVLDAHLQPVPIGVPGELYIGGLGLSRGYLRRPELTAERFITDPFSDEPDARLYKTGDLVRYLPDGNIEFLGRTDHQMKIRSFRIESGEIEEALRQHPEVQEAIVVAREDTPGDKRLVAYIVAVQRKPLAINDLRSFLKEKLPEYMLPSAFMLLDALPLTPNGKVDRRALPALEPGRATVEETFVAPRLLIHQQLVQIWEELLEVQPIGIQDNFFYLGGHSLLAARFVDRIEHVFGKRLALSTLFAGPTIEQLAEALQQQERADTRTSVLPVQVVGAKRPFFFLHGDWTGGAFYCFALARALGPDQPFYVLEPYKFAGLQSPPSFETVAAAHIEALRAVQPEGPYLLGGFCNGGLLAYEMARQLAAAGERVDFLALIEPTAPVRFEARRAISKGMSKLPRLGVDTQANLFLRVRHALRHVYRTLRPSGRKVQDFGKLLAIDPRLARMFPPIEALYNDYIGVFAWIHAGFISQVCPGKITFYWAGEEPSGEKVWLPVIEAKASEDIEKHFIPGTHMSCVTEHVQYLAACLSTCLSRIQEETLTQPVEATGHNAQVKTYGRKDSAHARTATISAR